MKEILRLGKGQITFSGNAVKIDLTKWKPDQGMYDNISIYPPDEDGFIEIKANWFKVHSVLISKGLFKTRQDTFSGEVSPKSWRLYNPTIIIEDK